MCCWNKRLPESEVRRRTQEDKSAGEERHWRMKIRAAANSGRMQRIEPSATSPQAPGGKVINCGSKWRANLKFREAFARRKNAGAARERLLFITAKNKNSTIPPIARDGLELHLNLPNCRAPDVTVNERVRCGKLRTINWTTKSRIEWRKRDHNICRNDNAVDR